jgi:hypothetical protein
MPSYLRRFYLAELLKVKNAEKEQVEKANKKVPGYTTPPKFKR